MQVDPKAKRDVLRLVGLSVVIILVLVIFQNLNYSGALEGVPSAASSIYNSTFNRFPDRPTTEDVITWSRKCQAGQATAETCERVQSVSTAKQQACAARMGVRDLIVAGISKMNAEQALRYCEQRFPEPR